MFAQALGRWGNWFNNELFGGPTSLPWKLQIHKIDVVTGHLTQCDVGRIGTVGVCGYYQPTFLYESLWDVALGFALIYVGRRVKLGQSNLFALYVMGYTVGRGWIEALREDHANHFFGVRLNDWTAILVFLGRRGLVLRSSQRTERLAVYRQASADSIARRRVTRRLSRPTPPIPPMTADTADSRPIPPMSSWPTPITRRARVRPPNDSQRRGPAIAIPVIATSAAGGSVRRFSA